MCPNRHSHYSAKQSKRCVLPYKTNFYRIAQAATFYKQNLLLVEFIVEWIQDIRMFAYTWSSLVPSSVATILMDFQNVVLQSAIHFSRLPIYFNTNFSV